MNSIPAPDEAYEILLRYNSETFHLEHAKTVAKVMEHFAKEYDPERAAFWRTVGILHDIDFELYPEQHCVKSAEILRDLHMDRGAHPCGGQPRLRHLFGCGAVASHGKSALCRR
jgi:putative nucleotidyltransferase with HDIG domain